MAERPPPSAVRKRSQGALRSSEHGQEQGERQTLHESLPGCDVTGVPKSIFRPSWPRSRKFSIAATFLVLTILATVYLCQPYIGSFISWAQPHGTHEQSSPASSGDLDYVLHPENHSNREPTTLHFQWRITSGLRRPDGVLKDVYLINDDFLGPTVECRSGDRLVITVQNRLPHDGVALHWHGLHMRNQNRQDGAVGFTQDAIEPGADFTYDFTIDSDQHGTFWYHAHDGVQRADGLFGGLIVHRPAGDGESESDRHIYDEERLLIIGDWYHRTAKDVMAWYMRAASFGNEPVPDSILINGVGSYNCSMAVPARPVDCISVQAPALSLLWSRTYRVRVINAGNLGGFTLRADAFFSMKAIEVDGGNAVDASAARSIGIIYPGQRTDLLLSTAGPTEQTATLELELDRQNFKYPNPALDSKRKFLIHVEDSEHSLNLAKSTGLLQYADLANVQSRVRPEHSFAEKANLTLVLYSTSVKLAHLDNKPYGFINQTSWKPQATHLLSIPRDEWDEHQFVPQLPMTSEADNFWVDIVLNNLDDGLHPFHVHGYDMWLLQTHTGFGWGSWNPFETPTPPGGSLEIQRPARRDTFYVPKRGYTVLRFKPDNPGIWMVHCHILWHQASGMAMGLQIG